LARLPSSSGGDGTQTTPVDVLFMSGLWLDDQLSGDGVSGANTVGMSIGGKVRVRPLKELD